MDGTPTDKGLLIVHTGNGKGKSTAALGMLVRALGHGFSCAVVQFMKGRHATSEVILSGVAEVGGGALTWDRCGEGFTWNSLGRERDILCAEKGWALARQHLSNPSLRFLLLDELNVALHQGLLDTARIISDLQDRPSALHVVVTGRGAPEALMDAADLVTEMREIKHPLKAGIRAQPGIEF